jgi:tetratricopeptide (TPR) repeat protein
MLARAKRAAVRVVARRPVYRLLPPGGLRTYAALKYLDEQRGQDAVVRYLQSAGAVPSRPRATALVAAKALFRAGQDELLSSTLDALARRHPDTAAVHLLHADLHAFHGRYEQALAAAQKADECQPSAATVARVVKYGYRVLSGEQADLAAVAAVRRYPRSTEALWPVAVACASPVQYQRVATAWRERRPAEPADLLAVVRQLATAASRAGLPELSAEWYRQGITLLAGSGRTVAGPQVTTLAGLGGRRAVEDLCRVLDGAGVPFFFAAGTALGLVRERRLLGADNDIDIGIFDRDWQREKLIELFRYDPAFDLDLHPQTQKVGLRHRGGSPVDVFRFYRQGDRVWHDGVFVRWWNTPFKVERREIDGWAGRRLPLPADPERYLTENYGEGWRTPWPGFDAFTEDAPNLAVTRPEYQRAHRLRRAYQALAAGDRPAAARELRRAGDDQLAATL